MSRASPAGHQRVTLPLWAGYGSVHVAGVLRPAAHLSDRIQWNDSFRFDSRLHPTD